MSPPGCIAVQLSSGDLLISKMNYLYIHQSLQINGGVDSDVVIENRSAVQSSTNNINSYPDADQKPRKKVRVCFIRQELYEKHNSHKTAMQGTAFNCLTYKISA